jgi:hypothetical protein
MPDLLPDCRARMPIGAVNRGVLGTWLPVFCANCGADGGLVPEENMTFLFYLCNTCAETYGQVANVMLMPDEVFYAKVAEEQLARYGRYLTPEEWGQVGEDPSHPLWTVLRDKPPS